MRTPTSDEIREFFQYDGWKRVRSTNHTHYEKQLPDGRLLESHRSFSGDKPLGPRTFKLFLSMQLELAENEFWAVLRTKKPARRPSLAPERKPTTLPLWLSRALQREGVSQADLAGLDEQSARARLNEIRSRPTD